MPLSPSQPVRTSFSAILLAIQAQIVLVTELDISAVKLIGRNPALIPALTSQQDILIRPSRFATLGVDNGPEEAAGRVDFRTTRNIYIFPRLQGSLDATGTDTAWLTGENTDYNIFSLEETIIDGLLEFFPQDTNGNQLTDVGLKLTNGEEPEKLVAQQIAQNWGRSVLCFTARYMPPLTQGNGTNPWSG
jgi:hypothetical protein